MEAVERHAIWLAGARTSFGLPALAAPELCLRLLGRRRGRRADPARFFVAFFGVREALLGILIAALRRNGDQLRPVVALGALADMGDTAFVLREVMRSDRRVEPAAALLLATGMAGSVASAAILIEVIRASRPRYDIRPVGA